ncbi:MAG: hypothetical protein ACXAC7_00925 [Candidatus Hodarchaeales archaeon]|jgi:hypothetical protein
MSINQNNKSYCTLLKLVQNLLIQKGLFDLKTGRGVAHLGLSGIQYEFPLMVNCSQNDQPLTFLIEVKDYKRPLGVDVLQKLQRMQFDLTSDKFRILLFTNLLSKASQRFVSNCDFQIMTRQEILLALNSENLKSAVINGFEYNKFQKLHQSSLKKFLVS